MTLTVRRRGGKREHANHDADLAKMLPTSYSEWKGLK